jgi:hypothetical protein
MKKLFISVSLLAVIVAGAFAQAITTEHGSHSDAIFTKLRKIDLLNQILPLLLTKDQINSSILPAIEKARTKEKQVLTEEDTTLEKLEPQIDEVLNKAIDKLQYPSKEFSNLIARSTTQMSIARSLALTEITENLTKALDASLTSAQKKIMEGSFDSNYVAPGKKPEDVKPEVKRQFFIQRVFLDPLTREILIALAEKMSDQSTSRN